MKIAILVQDITGFGGMVVVTLWLAKKLSVNNEVEIFSCKQRNEKPLYDTKDLNIIYLNIPNNQNYLEQKDYNKITEIISKKGFDFVILPVGCAFRNLYITCDINLIKKISNYSRIYFILHESPLFHLKRYNTAQDTPLIFLLKTINHKIRYSRTVKLFFKEAKKYIYKFVSLSNGCKNELKEYFGLDSIVIYNPYSFDNRLINNDEKENRIVWAGRFSGEKNIILLLKAWKLITNKNDWILELIGDGPDRQKIQTIIDKEKIKNVTLVGSVAHDQIKDIFIKSKIYCLPSYFEGFPTVISECMNYGVVPVVTKYDGFSDELLTDNTCIICPYSAKKIAKSLETLIHNPNLLKVYSENAYLKCKEFYTELENRNYDLNMYK